MNPHNDCVSNDPPGAKKRTRTCTFCKRSGLFDEMIGPNQSIECTYVYPPCEGCGQTPTCALDCPLCLGALSNVPPNVVVIGGPKR